MYDPNVASELQLMQWNSALDPETAGEWAQLQKMLAAGDGVDAAAFTQGRALQYESLENVLHKVTLTEEDCVFFKRMAKEKIFATVDQYDRLTDTGSEWGMGVGEADNPVESDPVIARAYAPVKFYRTLRKFSDVSMLVRNVQSPEAVQIWSGTQQIIKRLELDMFWAHPDVFTERVGGMIHLMSQAGYQGTSYDAAGRTLATVTKKPINQISALIRTAAGRATDLFYAPLLAEDMSVLYSTAERVILDGGQGERTLTVGGDIVGIQTAHGRINFNSAVFNKCGWACPSVAVGPAPPATPVLTSLTPGGTGGTIPTGTYFYFITAVNETGESAPVAVGGGAAASVTLGEKVAIVATPADSITTGFRVYRAAKNSANDDDCRFLWQFAWDGSGGTTWYDDGYWVPGCSNVLIGDMRPDHATVQLSQLLPLTKKKLADLGPYTQFLLNYYAAFRKAKPEWWGMIRNVLSQYDYDDGWRPLG